MQQNIPDRDRGLSDLNTVPKRAKKFCQENDVILNIWL